MTTPEQPDASRQLLRQQTPHTEIKSITYAQNIVSRYLMLAHKKHTTVLSNHNLHMDSNIPKL